VKNKQRFISSICFASLFLLLSCDCDQHANGEVIDEATKQLLPDVYIHIKGKPERHMTTDKTGSFHLTNISGGIGGCPSLKLIFEKPGYYATEVDFDTPDPKKIRLRKTN
jgi:hypothetical protein